MIRERVAEVDREMERLTEVRGELTRMLAGIPERCDETSTSPWPCETTFVEIGRGDA